MSQEVLSALSVVRAEKKARGEAFRKEALDVLRPLCIKYKISLTELKIDIHDLDAVVEDKPVPADPVTDIGSLPVAEVLTSTSGVVI